MSHRYTLTALAVASLFAQSAQSAGASPLSDDGTVIVTASRFSDAAPRVPANISVITREDIQSSPMLSLPELLKTRAGISVSSLSGQLGTDATVDLRGFGDSAGSNTLILLDGQRLNSIDSSGIDWASIPLSAVARIEIVRGSGSVLYGDRASGGVINIITDKSAKPRAEVVMTGGSFGYRSLDANAAGGAGSGYFNLTGHSAATDGWRQNNRADEWSLAGRAGQITGERDLYVDFATYGSWGRLPGSVFRSQFLTTPDMTRTPLDSQGRTGFRVRPGIMATISPTLTLEGELSFSQDRYHYSGYDFFYLSSYVLARKTDTWSMTPRVRWNHGLAGLGSETVVGVDYYDGKVRNNSFSSFSGFNAQGASQQSQAVYLQNVTALTSRLDLTLGARQHRVAQSVQDLASNTDQNTSRKQTAWDLGLATNLDAATRFYGRVGRTFRFANTDELFSYDPVAQASVFRGDLKPQQGTTREIGANWRGNEASARVSLYRMDLKDEIAYDGTTFANVNLPDTRRTGLEMEGQWKLARDWQARMAYSYTEGVFVGGGNAGNQIPMVPRNRATGELTWLGANLGKWSAVVTKVGQRRISGDAANIRDVDPGYTTVDVKATWDIQAWKLTARVSNLFNQRYSPFVGYSSNRAEYYYYPADPRSVFVSLGYSFR